VSAIVLPALDRNGWLVVAGKAVRSFAFGLSAVALGLYLHELALEPEAIGAVLSAALVGTTLLTLLVALRGDRIGRRRLLVAGALLMMLALLIPLVGPDPALLALIGLTGMVAVNSSDSTGLQTIDQALLPDSVPPRQRTAAFALYGLTSTAAAAAGGFAVGPLVAIGEALDLAGPARYTPAFVVYALAGVVAVLLALRLDQRADLSAPAHGRLPLHRSRPAVAQLSLLFGLDSFASGLVVQSFLAFWFASRFGLGPAEVGILFGAANVLSAASYPASAWLAARLGLIRTMVFTHIPANLLLIAMALVSPVELAAGLFLLRATMASMDVPARQSYLMSIVAADERTAAAGFTNLAKNIAQTAGPVVAGALLLPLGLGLPLIACGALKTTYDLALFALFRSVPAPEVETALATPGS
jgi:MFS family permease